MNLVQSTSHGPELDHKSSDAIESYISAQVRPLDIKIVQSSYNVLYDILAFLPLFKISQRRNDILL